MRWPGAGSTNWLRSGSAPCNFRSALKQDHSTNMKPGRRFMSRHDIEIRDIKLPASRHDSRKISSICTVIQKTGRRRFYLQTSFTGDKLIARNEALGCFLLHTKVGRFVEEIIWMRCCPFSLPNLALFAVCAQLHLLAFYYLDLIMMLFMMSHTVRIEALVFLVIRQSVPRLVVNFLLNVQLAA